MLAQKTERYNFQNLQLTPILSKNKIIIMQSNINQFYENKLTSLRDIHENSFCIIRDLLNESLNQSKLYNFILKILNSENINARLYLNVD